jgi:UDP:flavonoid glycosyltransferase YjiC (YdhE family)
MAHILTVARGLPSVVYPSVELARRLAVAGYRVTFAGPLEAQELAGENGLEFVALEASGFEQFLDADADTSILSRLSTVTRRRHRAREALSMAGFIRDLRGLEPDLILVNGEMHEHIIEAVGSGLPVVLLNSFVSIWRCPGLPPPHCSVQPGVGWKGGRLGISLFWLALRFRKWWRMASLRLRHLGCDRLSILGSIARDVGFSLREETDVTQWLIPFTYRHLPVLSLHALEFEFPHRPSQGVQYVGPMVLESRVDRSLSAEDRIRLEVVSERRSEAGTRRRVIYAAFGSVFSFDPERLRRLFAVVSARPDWDLLVSLSGKISRHSLGALPERVHVFDWLPQLEILRLADVMVTHGGINTIDECVLYGVPTLIYCGFETDMAGTAARVAHHGIGIVGDPQRDDTAAMRRQIGELLTEPRFSENLLRLQQGYRVYEGNRVAERAVESLLSREALS